LIAALGAKKTVGHGQRHGRVGAAQDLLHGGGRASDLGSDGGVALDLLTLGRRCGSRWTS
jgi:hypothetical protein